MIGAFTTAWDKDKDLSISQILSLTFSCLCSTMVARGMMGIPFKNPILLLIMCVCCLSSSTSTAMLGTDTIHRLTR